MEENISEALIDAIELSNSDTAGILVFLVIIMVGIALVSVHYRRKYEENKHYKKKYEEIKNYNDK